MKLIPNNGVRKTILVKCRSPSALYQRSVSIVLYRNNEGTLRLESPAFLPTLHTRLTTAFKFTTALTYSYLKTLVYLASHGIRYQSQVKNLHSTPHHLPLPENAL